MKTTLLRSAADSDWLRLRLALWPDADESEHREEMAKLVAGPDQYVQFIAHADEQRAIGLAEASIRSDYVNGTESSPVAFLEGIYVSPKSRRKGVARALVFAVSEWARSKGCIELASDAPISNRSSRQVHRSLGFVETERVVYFNLRLR
jgi:aminoglycoside 6'-N-acetyltransferase I